LKSEDTLLEQILSHESSRSILLEYIKFESLSIDSINSFIKTIPFEEISPGIWTSITRRLITGSKPKLTGTRFLKDTSGKEFRPDGDPFHGIIYDMRTKCGGNPHTKGLIAITASEVSAGVCESLLDIGWGGYLATGNRPNAEWVQIDFRSTRVIVTDYSLRTTRNNNYFTDWVIEVSNDKVSWTMIDERHTLDLTTPNSVKTFAVGKPLDEFFRYVRFRMIGPNTGHNGILNVSGIEFFGKILRSDEFKVEEVAPPAEITIPQHPHPLRLGIPPYLPDCDLCRQHITRDSFPIYRCGRCQFDLCVNCKLLVIPGI
jgi:hypothetical protein